MTQAAPIPSDRSAVRPSLTLTQVDVLLLGGLVIAAAVVRFPWLWAIPQFTDETLDTLRSFALYQGKDFPLTAASEYVGALHHYIEAVSFKLFGPSIYLPRLLVWILGAAAIPAAYWFAREAIGRTEGRLASFLLATSGVHIAASSHLAWPLSIAPLVVALWLACMVRAAERGSGRSLVAGAFFFGLALQLQFTLLAFVPGVVVYLLWRARTLLWSRWLVFAFGAFLLGYSNMVVYNATTGLDSFRSAFSRNAAYEDTQDRESGSYLARQGRVALTLFRLPATTLDSRDEWTDYALDPVTVAYAGLTILGLVLLAKRGQTLPILVIVSALLIFPLLGARHELLPRQGRYLAPLLPVIYTALAVGALWLGRAVSARLAISGVSTTVRWALGITAGAMLVLLPLVPLQRYYAEAERRGETNDRFFALLHEIEAARTGGERVLLDFQLSQEKLGGGGTALRAMQYLLTVRGVPNNDLTLVPERVTRRFPDGGRIVVITEKTYLAVGSRLPLETLDGRPVTTPPTRYGVYRLASPSQDSIISPVSINN